VPVNNVVLHAPKETAAEGFRKIRTGTTYILTSEEFGNTIIAEDLNDLIEIRGDIHYIVLEYGDREGGQLRRLPRIPA
jgi:hypothetical protein